MSGETEDQVSGWTTDTLREFFIRVLHEHDLRYQQRFEERDHRYQDRFTAQEQATPAALQAAEKAAIVLETTSREWRAQANEWRSTMDDREKVYFPRAEAMAMEKQNTERVSTLIDRLDKLEDRVNARENQGAGQRSAWSAIPILIGVLIAIVGLASRFLGQG